MSIPTKATVRCLNCGESFSATIWASINTDFASDLPERIIYGDFFTCSCPKCNTKTRLVYPILYNDMNHGFFIQLAPDEETYQDALDYFKHRTIQHPHYRVVRNAHELAEKVAIIQAERDDRIIELCKWYFWAQLTDSYPDFKCKVIYYYNDDSGHEMIEFINDKGKTMSCQLLEKTYSHFQQDYSALLDLEEKTTCEFDWNWANGFLLNLFKKSDSEKDSSPENTQVCENCGSLLPSGAKECGYCGESKEDASKQMSYCPYCGAKLGHGYIYCSNCGKKL